MTDRDTFAAAALTGLLAQGDDGSFSEESYVRGAYRWADTMLRERERTNHDAAPAAIVPEPEPEPAARRRPAGGTGGTDHGASPEARASVDSVAPQPTTHGESDRTDKAAPRPSEGTGDTPKPISGCVSDRPKPITGPDPDSRVWETHTPATHATHGEGSVPREDTQEPVAWGVASHFRVLATSISRMDAVDMQSDYAYHTEIVPLYRSPPVTKPMPKEKRAEVCAEPLAWAAIRENGQPLWLSYDRSGAEGMVNGMAEVVPLYRKPTLTDAERGAVQEVIDYLQPAGQKHQNHVAATLRGLLERLGGVE